MIHQMKLHRQPFDMIAAGHKTIELRLYDEKRQLIQVGDVICFTCSDDPKLSFSRTVVALHRFPSFAELYRTLPLDKCGYLPEELDSASPADMDVYYSTEKQKKYGVVGIELSE